MANQYKKMKENILQETFRICKNMRKTEDIMKEIDQELDSDF